MRLTNSILCRCILLCSLLLFFSIHAGATESSDKRYQVRALLIPQIETVFSSEIAAGIQSIAVDFGDTFAQGDQLITFFCERYRAELKKSQAEFNEASKTYEVNARLEKLQSVSELDVAISQARRDRAKAEVELRQNEVNKCTITAPFSGRVLERSASPFQHVMPGQPLLSVIDTMSLNMQLFVPSNWLNRVKPGLAFEVSIDETGKRYPAQITVLGARIDQVSQTLEIRARIMGNHPELLPGMSGTAYLIKP